MFGKELIIPLHDIKYNLPLWTGYSTFGASFFQGIYSGKENSGEQDAINYEEVTGRKKSQRKNVFKGSYVTPKGIYSGKENAINYEIATSRKKSRKKVFKGGVYAKAKVKVKSSKRSFEEEVDGEHGDTPKSEYELMIERNRAERMAFLMALKMDEAKASLLEAVGSLKPKKMPSVKKKIENFVPRKSNRLANIGADFPEGYNFSRVHPRKSEKALNLKLVRHQDGQWTALSPRADELTQVSVKEKSCVIPPELPFKEALYSKEMYETFLKDVNIQQSHPESEFVTYDKNVIQNLSLDEANIAHLPYDRTSTRFAIPLSWHPSPDTLIVAAGPDDLTVWNVVSKSSLYIFRTHAGRITHLQFNPWNPVQLISSSLDGTLRSGDMIKHIFIELYNVCGETACTSFDFLSETTCLVGQRNGQVALVDNRTEGKQCKKNWNCHCYYSNVNTVNVHPMNKNCFLSADNIGFIRLWDLRNMQEHPVANITHHKRNIHSAYFSPVTGNSILSTSSDDTVCIFDSTSLTSDIPLKQQMRHKNGAGLQPNFLQKATWLPNSEEAFAISRNKLKNEKFHNIKVYDKNMDILHTLRHDNISTVCTCITFHPFRPVLAGISKNRKLFVYT